MSSKIMTGSKAKTNKLFKVFISYFYAQLGI
jgi:hypothetical protein